MQTVTYWWKQGCATNTRQIRLLESAGCKVEVRDLLSEPWQPEFLGAFLADHAVADWFNPAAPMIKRGEVDPAGFDPASALARLIAEPILIRRPLIEVEGRRTVGFDAKWLAAAGIKLGRGELPQGCSHGDSPDARCAPPEGLA